MPKKADPEKKNPAGYYQSIYDTSKEFNKESYDTFIVRIPKGTKAPLAEYVKQMHERNPDDSKYNSLNAMVKALIQEESGIDLS